MSKLKIYDVDLNEKIMIIMQSKTKAGTCRQIPIHDKIIEILREKAQNTNDYYYSIPKLNLFRRFKQVLTI